MFFASEYYIFVCDPNNLYKLWMRFTLEACLTLDNVVIGQNLEQIIHKKSLFNISIIQS